jgi:hypothetical protein
MARFLVYELLELQDEAEETLDEIPRSDFDEIAEGVLGEVEAMSDDDLNATVLKELEELQR